MKTGKGITPARNSIFWAIRFVHESQRTGGESSSSTLVRRFRTALPRPFVTRFAVGGCNHAATSRLKICLGCSIRSFAVGSNITGGIIAQQCIGRCCNWTKRWRVGRHRNTRSCVVVNDRHIGGSPGYLGALLRCLLIGRWCGKVPLWEPYERRRSRTVLREARSEISGPTYPATEIQ